jgi:hypothetical protein
MELNAPAVRHPLRMNYFWHGSPPVVGLIFINKNYLINAAPSASRRRTGSNEGTLGQKGNALEETCSPQPNL